MHMRLMKSSIRAALGVGLVGLCAVCPGGPGERVPVMVGGEPEIDACGSIGTVSGLRAEPGNFLAVRQGPGTEYPSLATLPLGAHLWLCDTRQGWYGVVFGTPGQDCGVASPRSQRVAYDGPCSSGWVAKQYISISAG